MAEIDELGKGTAPDVTYMRFRLHADQREIVKLGMSQAFKEAETKHEAIAFEYIVAQYLAGPDKLTKEAEGVTDPEDMGSPLHQWMERIKLASKGDQDKALTIVFKAFDKAFPDVNLTVK